jgi:hypothetical protein
MKSDIVKKLMQICVMPDTSESDMTFYRKTLSDEQASKVEEVVINHYGFQKIIWADLPTGLTEDGNEVFSVASYKLADEFEADDKYKNKVAYLYSISFTPQMYDPSILHTPVKDGCVLSPVMYNPETFLPKRSITIEWSPEFPVDLENPMTWEDQKKMLHDKLEMVLENPDDYKPIGQRYGMLRFALK